MLYMTLKICLTGKYYHEAKLKVQISKFIIFIKEPKWSDECKNTRNTARFQHYEIQIRSNFDGTLNEHVHKTETRTLLHLQFYPTKHQQDEQTLSEFITI